MFLEALIQIKQTKIFCRNLQASIHEIPHVLVDCGRAKFEGSGAEIHEPQSMRTLGISWIAACGLQQQMRLADCGFRNPWAAIHEVECSSPRGLRQLADCGSAAKGDDAPQLERFYMVPLSPQIPSHLEVTTWNKSYFRLASQLIVSYIKKLRKSLPY